MVTPHQRRQFKKAMRLKPTKAESIFLRRLESAQIDHVFQSGMGFYIADFLIKSRMVVVELDGSSHDNKARYDQRRTEFIEACGFTVIRIKNEDAETFDLSTITSLPLRHDSDYRHAVGRISSLKTHAVRTPEERAHFAAVKARRAERNARRWNAH